MPPRPRPYLALAILTGLNFLNFIDRSILFQVQPMIQREFQVTKFQIGLLTTAFMICFVVVAPILGYVADRCPRRPIIVAGAMVWSVATWMTAWAWDFRTLMIRHAIVGIGEACMVVGPAYVADLFPEEKRGRMLGVLFMAVPAGTALGYLLGGVLGQAYGWRVPFLVAASPGVLAGLLLLLTPEPRRGANDTTVDAAELHSVPGLFRNRAYLSATAAMTTIAFALGAAQVWLPDFLVSVRGMTLLGAAMFIASIAIVNGFSATLSGGWLADRMRQRRHDGDYVLSAATMALALPLTLAALYTRRPVMFAAIGATHFVLLFSYVPLLAASVRSVGPRVRSTAMAIQGVLVHLLGDAASAPVVGHTADFTGSLQGGLLVIVAAVGLGAALLWYGRRFAPPAATETNPVTTSVVP